MWRLPDRQEGLLTLVALGVTVLPALLHLPPWMWLAVVALSGWKATLLARCLNPPRTSLLLTLAALGIGVVWTANGNIFGRNAGTELAILMLGLKLIEGHSRREQVFLAVAGYALLFFSALFSQTLASALLIVLGLALLTALLCSRTPSLPLRTRLTLALKLLGQAVPFMLVGFLLFPRAEFARWKLPEDAVRHLTGFSDRMSPGSVGKLAKSDAVAFRARFDETPPPQEALYWRGKVLWLYDGQSWKGDAQPEEYEGALPSPATTVKYSMVLEPHDSTTLFALDLPVQVPSGTWLTAHRTLHAARPVQFAFALDLVSAPAAGDSTPLDPFSRRKWLQLPEDENPRSFALARAWAGQPADKVVENALALFRRDFSYSLSAPRLRPYDQVDAFLFRTRTGFCEHFAGSFVFLMRAAGIPARVVVGYQGGEVDRTNRLVTVRQSHAHAWAEVWHAGQGWVRVDPVAVVPRDRVEAGTPAPPPVPAANKTTQATPEAERMRDRVRQTWEEEPGVSWLASMEFAWQRHIINYRERTQQKWLARFIGAKPGPLTLLAIWGAGFLLLLWLGILWLGRGGRDRRDAVHAIWNRFEALCARHGCAVQAGEGPGDYALRCAARFPHRRVAIMELRRHYLALRYGPAPREGESRLLAQLIGRLRL
jgi:transglutaminase-like putative cysteine protease